MSSFSCADLALSGFADRNISSSVLTVELCLASFTFALHVGQVYNFDVCEDREEEAFLC